MIKITTLLWMMSPLFLILGFVVIELFISFIDFVFIPRKQFKKKGIIISVNGIKDNDTGFASNGSVNQTTLLFKDGEIMTFDDNIPFIFLNKKCIVKYEKTKWRETICFKEIKYNNVSQEKKDE